AGPLLKEAGPVIEKGLQIAEDIDHPWLIGFGNLNLGMLKLRVGDLTDAKAAFSTGLHMLRDLPARSAVLYWLAETALRAGDYQEARAWCQQGVRMLRNTKMRLNSRRPLLMAVAELFAAQGQSERAAEIVGWYKANWGEE